MQLTPREKDKLLVPVAAMVARGMRLDIPAGTVVRFEPGQTRECGWCLMPARAGSLASTRR